MTFEEALSDYGDEADQVILDTIFQWVRQNFFPNWDKSGKWTIEAYHLHRGLAGSCSNKGRKILVYNHLLWRREGKLENPLELTTTIIHEAAHAVLPKPGNHGKRWRCEIAECCDRAKEMRMTSLYKRLREESSVYILTKGGRVTAKWVYSTIKELLKKDRTATFENIMNQIDYIVGKAQLDTSGVTFLDKKFKLCRRVYDAEKRKMLRSKTSFTKKKGA